MQNKNEKTLNINPFGYNYELKNFIETKLGAPIDQLLMEFEELPIAAASIDQGIDLLAGEEAVISHLVAKNYGIPCAHAPALLPLPLSHFYVQNQVPKRFGKKSKKKSKVLS
ncbi:Uncharacterized protein Fot_06100 [Forsythia ovata]|uniref:Uncharacterized protein n=1 Tax=Forsythia ovata TaxID=205694 RepID=A0ABD1WRZ9_9LAMI